MSSNRRVDLRRILAHPDLRRELMVPTLQATQAREGIETTREQAERAYYVVTERERAAFFDLDRFRYGNGRPDRRQEIFVRALRGEVMPVRFDIALSDFRTIEESPLAYNRVGILAHLFRDFPPVESLADAHQGVIARPDEPYIHHFWEVAPRRKERPWEKLDKGGDFSRFYYDSDLVIDWSASAKKAFHRLRDPEIYFKPGLTWPRRTQKGFNVRRLPPGCVFSDKGPSIFFRNLEHESLFLAVGNSELAEFILQALTAFGSWELTAIRRFPLALGDGSSRSLLGNLAAKIHDAKASWDEGNETSTRFQIPWLLCGLANSNVTIPLLLDYLARVEAEQESYIQKVYAELNDAVYKVYGIPPSTSERIKGTLGDRPPEVLWPQMEGRSVDQKRMEHVFRFLSYIVKRVLQTHEGDIVPFTLTAGEPGLVEQVRHQLMEFFPTRDVSQVEIEIANELKKSVKGYRSTTSIGQWLENAFFEYHCALYKNRPIIWHIASAQGTARFAFGALVSYYQLDRNQMAKLRGQYLREAIENFRREAALADKAGQTERRLEWQTRLEEARELDRRLQWIQEGHHEGPVGGAHDYRILTPWKSPENRPRGWEPDLDDGVKVNIEPLQKAGVLRIPKVV